ncbi:MAG: hypothetical protein ACXAC5_23910 [Promethearchaeota archaeon]
MRAISEEKRNLRKKIITILGLIISLVGAIITLLLGIEAFNREFWGGGALYLILIIPTGLAIFGDIVGFYKKAVGISISIGVGFIGIIFSLFDLTIFIPILMILIGGIVGFSANYDNLKFYINERKEKGIDEQMKRVYHLSIGLLICGWPLFIILLFLGFGIGHFFYGFLGFIGLLIGFVGLYGIIIYRSRPDKLRNYLIKRNKSKEEHKVQA